MAELVLLVASQPTSAKAGSTPAMQCITAKDDAFPVFPERQEPAFYHFFHRLAVLAP
jgi:hypothetical protein